MKLASDNSRIVGFIEPKLNCFVDMAIVRRNSFIKVKIVLQYVHGHWEGQLSFKTVGTEAKNSTNLD